MGGAFPVKRLMGEGRYLGYDGTGESFAAVAGAVADSSVCSGDAGAALHTLSAPSIRYSEGSPLRAGEPLAIGLR